MPKDLSNEKMTACKWIGVMGTMLGAFMAVLDIQITNSSLADISGGIGATTTQGSWISTAYLIGEIVTIPLTSYLSRVFTLRYYLLANVVLFLAFSGLCGVSTSLGEMICFRVGQGFTGGVFIPTALTVVVTMMPKNLQSVGTTVFGLTATLAPAIGPYLGGLLTDTVGWQWNFYINFVPGILMLIAVVVAMEQEPLNLKLLKQCDWFGIAAMAVGLGSLIAMLEQGQQDDWFGSEFIRTCGLFAGTFLAVFTVWELFFAKSPLLHLRLLASRNLGLSSVIGFVLGVGLYGTIYLVPLYLGDVQGYSPRLIGETLIWVGLPQLLIFPFLPLLLKKFDVRLLMFFGSLLFAVSCFMNSYMSLDYGKDQFIFANVVRALGQPFTIVPITGLALGTIARKDAGEGSALFNMFRNLGGSVGIAFLSSLVTRREQFHDTRIGERITAYGLALQNRIATSQARFVLKGFDHVAAKQRGYGELQAVVQRQASIMAFNDAFLVVGITLILGAFIVWFCKRPAQAAVQA
jgi:DHA2 family multidrug resistance protein